MYSDPVDRSSPFSVKLSLVKLKAFLGANASPVMVPKMSLGFTILSVFSSSV